MLSEAQKEFYEINGFLKLENLFETVELNKLCEEYENLFQVKFLDIIPLCFFNELLIEKKCRKFRHESSVAWKLAKPIEYRVKEFAR